MPKITRRDKTADVNPPDGGGRALDLLPATVSP